MLQIQIFIFIVGYIFISIEEKIQINKTAIALIIGVTTWICCLGFIDYKELNIALSHHLSSISEIVFFLLGAMVIVELIDAHEGFEIISRKIKTNNLISFGCTIGTITFFMSAILDNLTASIVMVTLLLKILSNKKVLFFMSSLVIIASNAGGAWSPIGDVTTTMLWIGGQISSLGVIKSVFLSSFISFLIPTVWIIFKLKKDNVIIENQLEKPLVTSSTERNLMLISGISVFLLIPLFKNLTNLPPYIGMLLGLGIIWVISEILHHQKDLESRRQFSASEALSRIDSSSILFFVGILLSVSALETSHVLIMASQIIDNQVNSFIMVASILGLLSSIFDNVPLVASTIGMYDLTKFPMDHNFWKLIAYCAGTGGSILIIGSAAGVAVMGMVKIDFLWYLKNISLPTLIGYFLGILMFILIN